MAREILASLLLGWMVLQALGVSARADNMAQAEQDIRDQLVQPTSLDFEHWPLSEILEYLSVYHDIEIVPDKAELKRMDIPLKQCEVTKKTTGRLDDALSEMLAPFDLSFMILRGRLLITSQPKSRAWQEQWAIDTGRKK